VFVFRQILRLRRKCLLLKFQERSVTGSNHEKNEVIRATGKMATCQELIRALCIVIFSPYVPAPRLRVITTGTAEAFLVIHRFEYPASVAGHPHGHIRDPLPYRRGDLSFVLPDSSGKNDRRLSHSVEQMGTDQPRLRHPFPVARRQPVYGCQKGQVPDRIARRSGHEWPKTPQTLQVPGEKASVESRTCRRQCFPSQLHQKQALSIRRGFAKCFSAETKKSGLKARPC